MKTKLIVLFFVSVVGLFTSGCVVTAAGRAIGYEMSVPAGVDVTNNIAGTYLSVETSRADAPGAISIGVGQTRRIPVCGVPVGNRYTIRCKVWDAQTNKYLGVVERAFSIHFDQSGRYGQSWVVNYYQPPITAYAHRRR